jgi:hypothetical protein
MCVGEADKRGGLGTVASQLKRDVEEMRQQDAAGVVTLQVPSCQC